MNAPPQAASASQPSALPCRDPDEARARLARILGNVKVPTFPEGHRRLLHAIRDERCSPAHLSRLVASDPGVSIRLMRTVNSAAFSLPQKVSSISHAIALLGRRSLEQTVLALGVTHSLPKWPNRQFNTKLFWRAAARRATIARALCERFEPEAAETCFTAALLLDMAVPLLVKARPRTYLDILEGWRAGEAPLHDLETETFGWNHSEVGSLLAAAWSFPEVLRTAIADHHARGTLGVPMAVRLVATMGEEADNKLNVDLLMATAVHEFGLPPDPVRSAVDTGVRRYDELARCLS